MSLQLSVLQRRPSGRFLCSTFSTKKVSHITIRWWCVPANRLLITYSTCLPVQSSITATISTFVPFSFVESISRGIINSFAFILFVENETCSIIASLWPSTPSGSTLVSVDRPLNPTMPIPRMPITAMMMLTARLPQLVQAAARKPGMRTWGSDGERLCSSLYLLVTDSTILEVTANPIEVPSCNNTHWWVFCIGRDG